jgi:TonB dependent receptor
LRGDLSDIPTQIYNPFTTREDPNNPGTFIRDPFPNNQIPQNLIDPGMLRFAQETLPAPVFTGNATFNGFDSTPYKENQHDYTFRIDHSISEKNSIWFRASWLTRDNEGSGGRPAIASRGEHPTKNIAVQYVRTFSPSTVLTAQFGRVHQRDDSFTEFRNLTPDFAKEIGFAETFAGSFTGGVSLIPNIDLGTDFFSGGQSNTLDPNFTNIWQYKVSASKIFANHTFKWGGEFDSNTFESIYASADVAFRPFQTSDPKNPGATGSALASFLLNVPDNAGRRNVHETTRLGGIMSFYFHDQWKATPKLTLNLGLRYDRTFIPPYGANGSEGENGGIETGSYDLLRGVYIIQKAPPLCSERGRAPCLPSATLPEHVEVSPNGKIYKDFTDNWQPRFGMAYRLFPNTALRASFGIFFDNWAAVTQTSQNYEGSWPDVAQQLAQNMNNPTPSQPTPNRTGTNPFPEGLFPAPTPFNSVLWYMDPNAQNPYSMQWNLGVQHQLTSSTVVTANYVGSGSRRLNIGGFYNVAVEPGPGEQAPRRPFPYIAPTFFDRSWGRANYHAFQFTLDKKYSSGLAYLVSYTWGKSIDIGCSGWYGVEGCSIQNPYKFNNDRSVSGFDVTHLLSVSWVYQLPFGPGKRFAPENKVLSHIIGNWQFNGITTLVSGVPYDVGVGGDIANTGNSGCCAGYYERLNVVGEHKLSNPTPQAWFNRAAFAVPAPFTFGNSGRNILRTDGTNNFDLSIFRQFPIREQWKVEFRAEMFNAFNTPTYSYPERNFSSPNFGQVTSTSNTARQIQFGLKILF